MTKKKTDSFCPANQQEWRNWLTKNHDTSKSVWLILFKKNSGKPTISWSEAVDEALCFGWIDSKRKTIDDEKFKQIFSKRKPKGTWSKINKEKVSKLIDNGKMTPSGIEMIEIAKKNGSWNLLDEVEALIIPEDLEIAFKNNPGSKQYFRGLSKSDQKFILQRLLFAKRPETREKRIRDTLEQASKDLKTP